MAIIKCEGEIIIDLVDFWSFLDRQIPGDKPIATSVTFDIESDAVIVEAGKATYHIDAADFWVWVGDDAMDGIRSAVEIVYGVPAFDLRKGELRITFALDSSSNPRSWPEPPKCLAEWRPEADPFENFMLPKAGDDGSYDLCDRYKGKYADVVRRDSDGKWRALYGQREVVEHQPNRAMAREKLIQWLRENVA